MAAELPPASVVVIEACIAFNKSFQVRLRLAALTTPFSLHMWKTDTLYPLPIVWPERTELPATKILWGQVLTVVLIVLVTTWCATQWTAWRLGFQPQLGSPWFEFAGQSVYPPPAFFWWWFFYDAYAPEVFIEGALFAASGSFIAIAVAIWMSVWRAREAKNSATYGSARWATRDEIKAEGMVGPDGVVLGILRR
jgi:type IV secretory pathway TraG/TraD family ATPase VirD4